jgi:hypothetical protein
VKLIKTMLDNGSTEIRQKQKRITITIHRFFAYML